jgi:hypothetical protein
MKTSAEYSQLWRNRHPAQYEATLWYAALKKYNITQSDYVHLLIKQGGTCAFCWRREYIPGRRLGIDHDHVANRVRGLVCAYHNRALAAFGDNVVGLFRALMYTLEP